MPEPTYTSVTIDKKGGDITLTVSIPEYPQSIAGQTWEYTAPGTKPVNSFAFTTDNPQSILGKPAAINQHLYWVDGAVIHQDNSPPSLYQVRIEILQGGKQSHLSLQPANGPGQISTTDITIALRFQLIAA